MLPSFVVGDGIDRCMRSKWERLPPLRWKREVGAKFQQINKMVNASSKVTQSTIHWGGPESPSQPITYGGCFASGQKVTQNFWPLVVVSLRSWPYLFEKCEAKKKSFCSDFWNFYFCKNRQILHSCINNACCALNVTAFSETEYCECLDGAASPTDDNIFDTAVCCGYDAWAGELVCEQPCAPCSGCGAGDCCVSDRLNVNITRIVSTEDTLISIVHPPTKGCCGQNATTTTTP